MGLNLNYTPNRLVDITTLTEDQWLSWRRKGIGGSDVAVALNSSPYRTARDLYYDKIGVVMSDDASSDYIGMDTCYTCWLEECLTTNCLGCKRGNYPDCKWIDLKKSYQEEDK